MPTETPASEGTRVPAGVPNINERDSSALRVNVSFDQRSSLQRSIPESSAISLEERYYFNSRAESGSPLTRARGPLNGILNINRESFVYRQRETV